MDEREIEAVQYAVRALKQSSALLGDGDVAQWLDRIAEKMQVHVQPLPLLQQSMN